MGYKSSNGADSRIVTEKQRATGWVEGVALLSAKLMLNINGSLSCCLYLGVKQINSSANSLLI